MKAIFSYVRMQWPVGHGGFHTGQLAGEQVVFRYFYDCGSKTSGCTQKIRGELSAGRFEFGVISHFDRDHYSALDSARNLKKLYLPYMTDTDMLFLALSDQAKNNLSLEDALEGFTVLKNLSERGTKVIMVNDRSDSQADTASVDGERPEELTDQITIHYPKIERSDANIYGVSAHHEPLQVKNGLKDLLYFKFFNYYNSKASKIFKRYLNKAVKNNKLVDGNNKPYQSVEIFLEKLKADCAGVVALNGRAMQKIYIDALSDQKIGIQKKYASNLSSLTMYSSSTGLKESKKYCARLCSLGNENKRALKFFHCCDGWMLTGDLELTQKIWPIFAKHYRYELPCCRVFNIPHHGSKNSLCKSAVKCLSNNFFIIPVNKNSKKHPEWSLVQLLRRHKVRWQKACDGRICVVQTL